MPTVDLQVDERDGSESLGREKGASFANRRTRPGPVVKLSKSV
jgi:hypothetical protein